MRLLSLHLQNFRSYSDLQLDVSGGLRHLFIGPNGSGKTNILEAISVLSLTKSGLGQDEEHLPRWNEMFYRVRAEAQSDSEEALSLEVAFQTSPRRQKACFINDVRVSIADMVGRLPSVLFLPQDLQLFSGPPAERRRFLDQLLSQVSSEYLQALVDYQKFLKQRNALLRQIAQGMARADDLEPWDAQLAERGGLLTLRRLELMEMFGLTLGDEVRNLGERWEDIRIVYERPTEAHEREAIGQELLGILRRHRERDVLLQSTTAGPHREDWHIAVDGRDLSSFASRGQQRSCVLALLFLEASFLELRRGERPIILLDDVFSELDDRHQEGVMRSFSDHQVFITGTHLPKETFDAVVWDVKEGTVTME